MSKTKKYTEAQIKTIKAFDDAKSFRTKEELDIIAKHKDRISAKDSIKNKRLSDIENARKLIGNVIVKDGRNYGCIVAVKTLSKGSDYRVVVVTDKDLNIDAKSIFKILNDSSDKHYPEGSKFSHNAFQKAKSTGKGGGALNGSSEVSDEAISFYRKHYKKGYRS